MDTGQASQWLEDLCNLQPLKSITVHGGEPLLCCDETVVILEKAQDLGVPERWIITNGFWAKDYPAAGEKLRILKQAGLTAITFSVDAFHQEYIPFETVKTGIVCAMQHDFDTVSVDSYFLFARNHENRYNSRTAEYLQHLREIPRLGINTFVSSFEGRAAKLLAKQEYATERVPAGKCNPPFWLGDTLMDPETIEVDHDGNVTVCPGISLGNATRQPLTEIVKHFDYEQHPIIKIIVEKGPIGLFELARSRGYEGPDRFVNECHLCYEMRRYLHKQYPQYLAPESCYDDD